MNIRKLIDRFTEDWAAKVICLVLAFLLYIFNRASSLQEKTFTIPLKVEAEGLMMPAVDLPKYIKVTVTASKDSISSVKESDFSAKIDLNNFVEAGEYVVPVKVTVSEEFEQLETFECRPRTEFINVLLDEKVLRYIPVEVAPSGNPAYGYSISGFDVSPATVKVVGPSRIVEKTKRIYTRKLIVDGAAKSFSQEVKLDNSNSKLSVLADEAFKVTVMIEPTVESRTFEKITPEIKNLSDDLIVSEEISKINFTASGTTLTLDTVEPEKCVSVDLSEISEPGRYEIPVKVELENSLTVSEQSVENVFVTVIKKDLLADEIEEPLSENQQNEVAE